MTHKTKSIIGAKYPTWEKKQWVIVITALSGARKQKACSLCVFYGSDNEYADFLKKKFFSENHFYLQKVMGVKIKATFSTDLGRKLSKSLKIVYQLKLFKC